MEIRIEVAQWSRSAGWECSSQIDTIPVTGDSSIEEIGEEYANNYFSDLELYRDVDLKIMIYDEDNNCIYKSKWCSEIQGKTNS